jgi:hypothetical protein
MNSSSNQNYLFIRLKLKRAVSKVKQTLINFFFLKLKFILIGSHSQKMYDSSLTCFHHNFIFIIDIFVCSHLLLYCLQHFLALFVRKGVGICEESFHTFWKSKIEVQLCIILFSLHTYKSLILQKR